MTSSPKPSTSLDLAGVPLVDGHCHLFDLSAQERAPEEVLSLSLERQDPGDLRATLVHHRLLNELADLLGCEPEQAWSLRMQQARRDYPGHLRRLFSDVNLDTLLIDTGYKPAAVDLDAFRRTAPCRVHYMFRLESVLDGLWQARTPLPEAEERVDAAVAEAVDRLHVVALKTIIGYRTGLAVGDVDRAEAERALVGGDEKTYRDYFFLRLLDACRRFRLPLQVHSGFGESNIYVERNNPLLLKPLLESGRAAGVPVILLHGGHPYAFEAGYMTAMFPNVFVEFSEVTPFAWPEMPRTLRALFSMAPTTRIMYGSDGFVLPETHWLGARIARAEVARLLGAWVEEGALRASQAERIARDVFCDNARRVYGLGSS